jgi:hypothetical protein
MMSSMLSLCPTKCSRCQPLDALLRAGTVVRMMLRLRESETSATGDGPGSLYGSSPCVLAANQFQSTSVKGDLGTRLISLTSRVLPRRRSKVILRLW